MSDSKEKCSIFIDGGYLNKVLRSITEEILSDIPKLDYLKLSDKICFIINVERLRTYYYQCLPFVRENNEQDKIREENMKKFLLKLNRLPRFDVKKGELQLIKGVFKQKMIDVLMSLDIVDICFDKQIEHVVLIAGDKDFIPAVEKAKAYGAIVHLLCHKDAVNQDLLNEVDEIHYLNEDFLKDCLL